jgi:D-alanyl-D-alanine carboxypeptidase
MALGQPSAAAPLPAAPPVQGGANIAIQIGAFATEAEARQQLEAARLTSPEAVGAAAPATPAVNIGGRRFYRARFTGFDAAGAARACTELRRRQIDCHVARVE